MASLLLLASVVVVLAVVAAAVVVVAVLLPALLAVLDTLQPLRHSYLHCLQHWPQTSSCSVEVQVVCTERYCSSSSVKQQA